MRQYLLFAIVFYSVSVIDITVSNVLIKGMILLYEIVVEYVKRELAALIEAAALTGETATVPVSRDPDQQ